MPEREPVVALLRGINLGGHNKVSMSELRSLLAAAGFEEVRTILQSGNVIVTPPGKGVSRIGATIEKAIEDGIGLGIRVMTRTREEMAAIVAGNPFPDPGTDPKFLHAVFLDTTPNQDRVSNLDPDRSPPDRFSVAGREIYVQYPAGSGRSKLNLEYFEKRLGVAGTARNWNTVTKLLALLAE